VRDSAGKTGGKSKREGERALVTIGGKKIHVLPTSRNRAEEHQTEEDVAQKEEKTEAADF